MSPLEAAGATGTAPELHAAMLRGLQMSPMMTIIWRLKADARTPEGAIAGARAVWANSAALDGIGYTLADLQALRPPDVCRFGHSDDDPAGAAANRAFVQGDSGSAVLPMRAVHRDGRIFPIDASVVRLHDGGAPLMITFSVDIGTRLQQADALRASEERYRRAIAGAREGIWEVDVRTGEIYASPRCRELLGIDDAPRTARPFIVRLLRAVHPAERRELVGMYRRLRARGSSETMEFRVRDAAGEWRWREARCHFDLQPGSAHPAHISGSLGDVDLRKRFEDELIAARDRAERAASAKADFVAVMSHEIRTPMNGVIGMVELLSATGLDARQQTMVRTLRSSAESLLTIINDVLDFSKIEAGKLQLERAPMRVRDVVTAVLDALAPTARDRGIALQVDMQRGLPEDVEGDANRLRQVLVNLIGNAIKFTRAGGVRVSVQRAPTDAGRMRVEVVDTGIGIAAEHLARLFDPFTQADRSTTRVFGGTGLGLSICKRLVEAMGGRIGAWSQPGGGSTFWFELPLQASATDHAPVAGAAAAGDAEVRLPAGLRVLVAEDNLVNQRVAVGMLERLGADVTIAADGAQAVQCWQAGEFDLVLMDCRMPGVDGYEAARRIRAEEMRLRRPRTPIVALTANASREDAEQSLRAGMDAHLAKPVRLADLRRVLQEHVLGPGLPDWFEQYLGDGADAAGGRRPAH